MIRIGICDDNSSERENLRNLCEEYLLKENIEYTFEIFTCGEEVLKYCEKESPNRIDLLFLDIEMNNVDGIEVKERLKKIAYIWRIVFVSSHLEAMGEAFGLKTLGFVKKPPKSEEISKWIAVVLEELSEDILIGVEEPGMASAHIRLEEIELMKSERNYTKIYLVPQNGNESNVILSSKNLKYWEEKLAQYPVMRVHKSYLVHLAHVLKVEKGISMRNVKDEIPVGRAYKEQVKLTYQKYVMDKMRKRL